MPPPDLSALALSFVMGSLCLLIFVPRLSSPVGRFKTITYGGERRCLFWLAKVRNCLLPILQPAYGLAQPQRLIYRWENILLCAASLLGAMALLVSDMIENAEVELGAVIFFMGHIMTSVWFSLWTIRYYQEESNQILGKTLSLYFWISNGTQWKVMKQLPNKNQLIQVILSGVSAATVLWSLWHVIIWFAADSKVRPASAAPSFVVLLLRTTAILLPGLLERKTSIPFKMAFLAPIFAATGALVAATFSFTASKVLCITPLAVGLMPVRKALPQPEESDDSQNGVVGIREFERQLEDECVFENLRERLVVTHCEECALFLEAMREEKKFSGAGGSRAAAKKIYDKFLKAGADLELNLSLADRSSVEDLVRRGELDLSDLEQIRKEMISLIYQNLIVHESGSTLPRNHD